MLNALKKKPKTNRMTTHLLLQATIVCFLLFLATASSTFFMLASFISGYALGKQLIEEFIEN